MSGIKGNGRNSGLFMKMRGINYLTQNKTFSLKLEILKMLLQRNHVFFIRLTDTSAFHKQMALVQLL